MNGQQEQKKEEQVFLSLSLSTTHATAQHFYVMWPLRTVYDVDDDASGHTYIWCPCNLGKKKKKKKKETKHTILTLSSPALSVDPRHTYMSSSLTNNSSRIIICSFVNLRSTQVIDSLPLLLLARKITYLEAVKESEWVKRELETLPLPLLWKRESLNPGNHSKNMLPLKVAQSCHECAWVGYRKA